MNLPRAFCCCACNSKNLAASSSVSMLMSVDFVWFFFEFYFFLRQLLKNKKDERQRKLSASVSTVGEVPSLEVENKKGNRIPPPTTTTTTSVRNSATHGGELQTRWRSKKVVETSEVCESRNGVGPPTEGARAPSQRDRGVAAKTRRRSADGTDERAWLLWRVCFPPPLLIKGSDLFLISIWQVS